MSYASCVLALADAPATSVIDGREYLTANAAIQGAQPVTVLLRAYPGGSAAKALAAKAAGELLLVSGEVQLNADSTHPVLDASVVCNATDSQYLNEVCIVGRVASDYRATESGKSGKRTVAVNRYRKNPETEEPEELTDWFGVRGFGYNRDKLEAIAKGSLVEVTGCFEQLTNAKKEPYCEIKARAIRVHKSRGGNRNPAAGTSAAGYDQDAFNGSPDDIADDWN
jgi:single-stranded DNA-binding protein